MAKIVLSVPGGQGVFLAGSVAADSVNGAADDHTIAATRPHSQDFGGARATFSFIDRDGAATVLAGSGNETLFTTAGDQRQVGFGPADMVYAASGNATLGGVGSATFDAAPGHDRVTGGFGGGTFVAQDGRVTLRDDPGASNAAGEGVAEYSLSGTRISHGSTTIIQPDNTRFTFSGLGEADKSPLA